MRLLTLCLFICLFACQKDTLPVDQTPISVADVAAVAQMNQTLAWKIFTQEKLAKPGENVLLSPFSIHTALLQATNGAQGKTADELLSVMNCSGCDIQEINPLHQDLTTLLTQQSGQPQVTVANHYFYDASRMTVKGPFLDALHSFYQCEATSLPFENEAETLKQINGWVKANTQQKIDAILDRVTPLDVAFLINALHFKADWAIGFSEELTVPLTFTKEDGQQVTVEFVNADRDFAFVQNQDYNLVDIPFQDSTYSISFIQPSASNQEVDWAITMDGIQYTSLLDQVDVDRAMVFFPRLKLAYENDLIQSLKNLGVQDAFSDRNADFTLMGTANQNIFINQIKHKTILEVDEHGAEGAAVTSIGFGVNSAPPTIKFDRPFILVLRHISTQTPLFIGYVSDPAF